MGGITLLGVAGSIFQNIGPRNLATVLPDRSFQELQGIMAGASSPSFTQLSGEIRVGVIEEITHSIRTTFAVSIAFASLGLLTSLTLSVSNFIYSCLHKPADF